MNQAGKTTKEYPEYIISRCRQSINQFARIKPRNAEGKRILRTAADTPAFFQELKEAEPGKIYDSFEVEEFCMDEKGQLSLDIQLSLRHSYERLKVSADIINHRTKEVVRVMEPKVVSDTYGLDYRAAVSLGEEMQPEDLSVIAYAAWGSKNTDIDELALLHDYGESPLEDVEYRHIYPKKEEGYLVFPESAKLSFDLEKDDGKDYEKEPDHIVIALYRVPEKTDDLDYLCLFGNKNSKPYIGVPGKGVFRMPQNGEIDTRKGKEPWARCMISPINGTGGGKMLVASGGSYSPLEGKIKLTRVSATQLAYDMTDSWGVNYDEIGQWRTKYFDYYMEINCWLTIDGASLPWQGVITSRESIPAYRHIKPLAIKYGCFAKGTMIRMGDGSLRKIEEVQIGDLVLSEAGSVKEIKNIWRGIETRILRITTENGNTIAVTKDHPLFTENEMLQAGGLTEGMMLKMERGMDRVKKVEYREEEEIAVYNLEIDGGTVYADGFAAGDFTLQNRG